MKNPSFVSRAAFAALTLIISIADVSAQNRPLKAATPPEPSMFESIWFYLGVLAVGGLVALLFLRRRKEKEATSQPLVPAAEKELKLTYKETSPARKETPATIKETQPKTDLSRPRLQRIAEPEKPAAPVKFAVLPVSTFTKLARTNPFPQLPTSTDSDLLEAIELTGEDSEEDLTVRTRALKLLATFKTSNAVMAISQIALYDLSSKLRADAVGVLAEMDHESVFETIVTACADPTREVRAAAARALSKISFDRGQAWARIVESGDAARMRHAARCAIDAEIVTRSLDRLVHPDRSIAYEAFALVALLIRSGETEPIIKAIGEHKVESVKLALLHALQVVVEERTFDELGELMNQVELPASIAGKVYEVRSCVQMMGA